MFYKSKDLKLGKDYERLFIHKINEIYDASFISLSTYSQLDFYCAAKNIYVEVKNRKNYPSWAVNPLMIGENKIKFGREKLALGSEVHFYWRLKDGLYRYKLKNKDEKGMWCDMGGRCDRGRDERKKVYYICLRLMDKIN